MSKANTNYITVHDFSESSVARFRSEFWRLETSDQPIIPIIIDSYGGEVYSLLSMLSLIESSNKDIATICDGKAMSCGAVLFGAGKKGLRFFGPHATMMIHQVSSASIGKLQDIAIDAEHTAQLNSKIFAMLDKFAAKKAGYFEKIIFKVANTDLYLDAEEVVAHGLADHICSPRFSTEIETTISSQFLNYKPQKLAPKKVSKSVTKLK